jgi:cell division protein FtsL
MKRGATTLRGARVLDVDTLRWLVVAIAALVGVVVSGIAIAWSSQTVRALHIAIDSSQREQDALLAEYSRLLIERSTLGAYQNVDQVAERRLSMTFPETVERVTP